MTEKMIFKINEADNGSDELEAIFRHNHLTITIENPWAGSTETGFGCSSSIRINKEQVKEFANWLLTILIIKDEK